MTAITATPTESAVAVAHRTQDGIAKLTMQLATKRNDRADAAARLAVLEESIVAEQVAVDVGDVEDDSVLVGLVADKMHAEGRLAALDEAIAALERRLAAANERAAAREWEKLLEEYAAMAAQDEAVEGAMHRQFATFVETYTAAKAHEAAKRQQEQRIRDLHKQVRKNVPGERFTHLEFPADRPELLWGNHGLSAPEVVRRKYGKGNGKK